MTDALDRLYDTFTDSVFRLETLPAYSVPEYDERLRAFLQGEPLPPSPPKEAWLALVRERVAAGGRIHRVHVVERPLSDYLRYELAVYPENVAAGEDVRIADRAAHPGLDVLRRDFILFDGDTDHATAVLFRYSFDGRILSRDVSADPADVDLCRRQRDLALAHSVPLEELATPTS